MEKEKNKFNLSERRRYCGCGNKNMFLKEDDVKEFIKQIEKELKVMGFEEGDFFSKADVMNIIKEFAGEQLTWNLKKNQLEIILIEK